MLFRCNIVSIFDHIQPTLTTCQADLKKKKTGLGRLDAAPGYGVRWYVDSLFVGCVMSIDSKNSASLNTSSKVYTSLALKRVVLMSLLASRCEPVKSNLKMFSPPSILAKRQLLGDVANFACDTINNNVLDGTAYICMIR